MFPHRKATFATLPVLIIAGTISFASNATAASVPISLSPSANTASQTEVLSGDLTGLGLSEIGSITITDDGTTVGGASGIFSGFDLDGLFLDDDGDLSTSSDRNFASGFDFSAGSTRPTSSSVLMPTTDHPGPTFGSIDSTTIDTDVATLDTFDATAFANVNLDEGSLTLGDGGSITATFDPTTPVGANLFLLAGEVGGQPGEGLSASVTVSDQPVDGEGGDNTAEVPSPGALLMMATGLVGLGLRRLRS